MTSEAFILHRNALPSSYLENYISFQAHFSLKELILKYQEHSGWWVWYQYCNKWSFIMVKSTLFQNVAAVYLILWYSIFPSGTLPVHPQSYSASPALLHSFTSFLLSIQVMHKQLGLPNRLSVTWSPQTPLNWCCTSSPVSSHRQVCRRCSRVLCCLTLQRSASELGILRAIKDWVRSFDAAIGQDIL